MSLDCNIEVKVIEMFQALSDAVSDFVGVGGSVAGFYIVTPTGLSFDLENLSVPSAGSWTGIKVNIGELAINIPGQAALDAYMLMSPTSLILNGLYNVNYPGSNTWYYQRNLESHQQGTAYDPVEWYSVTDSMVDGTIATMAFAIAYALVKIGLIQVVQFFMKRLFKTATLVSTQLDTIQSVCDSIEDKVDILDVNVDTVLDEVTNESGNKLKALMKLVDVNVSVVKGETYAEAKTHDLRAQIVYVRNYMEAVYQYLLDSMSNQRPDPNDAQYWIET